jgi:hypothetical protein
VYTTINFQTKAELKRAIDSGTQVTVFQPGPFAGNEPIDGTVYLEGPHYPKPHRWYARATLHNGLIVKVR